MAGRIAGITVEISADASKFQSAMRTLDSSLKSTKSNLKDIDKLLKLNPGNVELLTQKQKNLQNAIKTTEERLQELKREQSNVAEGTQEWDDLQREIIATENELERLEKEYKNFGSVAAQQVKAVGEKMSKVGDKMAEVGKTLTRKVTVPIVAGFTAAVKTTADFDKAMSDVAATMGKTADEIDDLREYARKMGAETAYSATEAAEAMNYMALAGYKTEDIMRMLPTVLNLAAAGNIDLATASDMVTDAQSALGLTMEETETLINEMAKTSTKSNTSVAQLGEGILKIGATARSVAGGTKELNTVLGILADNGIKGAEGGTHLRNILLSLQDAAEAGAKELKDLGVNVYDANGNMRSMEDIMLELQAGIGDMSQEARDAMLSGLFNKTDLAAVNALLGTSAERWTELGEAIGDSGDAAEDMAKTKLDNLSGQLTLLKSAIQELAISFGDALMPTIRKVVTWIQGLVDKFNKLSPKTKEMIAKIALIAAAIGPLLVVGGKLIGGIGRILIYAPLIVSALSGLTAPMILIPVLIAAVVAGIVWLIKNWDKVKKVAEKVTKAISKAWENMKKNLKKSIEATKKDAVTAWQNIKARVTTLANTLKTSVSNAWTNLKTAVSNTVNSLKASVTKTWTAIKTAVSNTVNALKTSVQNTWNNLRTAVTNTVNNLNKSLKTAWSNIKTNVTTIATNIKTAVTTTWNNLKTAVVNTVNNLKSALNTAWTNIKTAVTTAVTNIKTSVTTSWDNLKTAVINTVNNIKTSVTTAWTNIKTSVTTTIDNLKTAISTKWENIKTTTATKVSEIVEKVKSLFSFEFSLPKLKLPTWADIKGTLEDIVKKVKDTFSFSLSLPSIKLPHVTVTYTAASSTIAKWFGINSIPHLSISWYKRAYANAMMFNSPTVLATPNGLKGFGDGHGAEIVLGLNKLRELVGSYNSGNVTVNVYAQPGMNEKALADMVAQRIQQTVNSRRAAWA